jgi:NDP-sugar pyrophosphorylase family protein
MIKEVEFLVLAGGQGERMKSITGQSIPKCALPVRYGIRGIDVILNQLDLIKADATFGSNNHFYQYEEIIKGTNHRMLWQKPGGITQAVLQTGNRILIIASDCIFPFEQLRRMIEQHQQGTISWAVTKYKSPLMSDYAGCDVVNNNIIGRSNDSIIRSPTMVIDFEVLKPFVYDAEKEDLYYTVMRRVEKENLSRVVNGQKSILNAFFLDGPIMDYGTPDRLKETGRALDDLLHPKSNE